MEANIAGAMRSPRGRASVNPSVRAPALLLMPRGRDALCAQRAAKRPSALCMMLRGAWQSRQAEHSVILSQ